MTLIELIEAVQEMLKKGKNRTECSAWLFSVGTKPDVVIAVMATLNDIGSYRRQSKKVFVPLLTVRRVKLNSDAKGQQTLDTGTSNGSGELNVSARFANEDSRGVHFSHVWIEASNKPGQDGIGYADWPESGLIAEAQEMLEIDYCFTTCG